MIKSGKNRILAYLALLRLSESDLRSLHETVSEMSPSSFLELIRDIAVKIDNSMALIQDQVAERASFNPDTTKLYHEIDQIRRKELRVTVQHFADMLADSLSRISIARGIEIPRFEPRRGFEAWIGRLVRAFSEQDLFDAAMRIRHKRPDYRGSDWKL